MSTSKTDMPLAAFAVVLPLELIHKIIDQLDFIHILWLLDQCPSSRFLFAVVDGLESHPKHRRLWFWIRELDDTLREREKRNEIVDGRAELDRAVRKVLRAWRWIICVHRQSEFVIIPTNSQDVYARINETPELVPGISDLKFKVVSRTEYCEHSHGMNFGHPIRDMLASELEFRFKWILGYQLYHNRSKAWGRRTNAPDYIQFLIGGWDGPCHPLLRGVRILFESIKNEVLVESITATDACHYSMVKRAVALFHNKGRERIGEWLEKQPTNFFRPLKSHRQDIAEVPWDTVKPVLVDILYEDMVKEKLIPWIRAKLDDHVADLMLQLPSQAFNMFNHFLTPYTAPVPLDHDMAQICDEYQHWMRYIISPALLAHQQQSLVNLTFMYDMYSPKILRLLPNKPYNIEKQSSKSHVIKNMRSRGLNPHPRYAYYCKPQYPTYTTGQTQRPRGIYSSAGLPIGPHDEYLDRFMRFFDIGSDDQGYPVTTGILMLLETLTSATSLTSRFANLSLTQRVTKNKLQQDITTAIGGFTRVYRHAITYKETIPRCSFDFTSQKWHFIAYRASASPLTSATKTPYEDFFTRYDWMVPYDPRDLEWLQAFCQVCSWMDTFGIHIADVEDGEERLVRFLARSDRYAIFVERQARKEKELAAEYEMELEKAKAEKVEREKEKRMAEIRKWAGNVYGLE